VAAAGFSQVKFAALGSGVVLSLLFSPIVALLLTLGVYSPVVRFGRLAGNRDCVCVDKPQAVAAVETGALASVMMTSPPSVRWAPMSECETGVETVRFNIADSLHWFSGAATSFARGLNDTPKITAVLLVAVAGAIRLDYLLVALAMALGGLLVLLC
jgi:PiT family inorganic phosphate transporter